MSPITGTRATALILDDLVATEELHEDAREALLLDDIPMHDRDADVIEFLHLLREGDTPPLDLVARLMEAGYDVEALEASVPV